MDVPSPDTKGWARIIATVQNPVGVIALLVLVTSSILFPLVTIVGVEDNVRAFVVKGFMGLMFLVAIVVLGAFVWQLVHATRRPPQPPTPEMTMEPTSEGDEEIEPLLQEQGANVLFANEEARPTIGFWSRELRQHLHQAVHYSVPTYYLDTRLNVIDWNIAFEVVFEDLVGRIRGKHVNWFIARLANYEQVFDHARSFTKDVLEKGAFPYVDKELIVYESPEYGTVRTIKVATQLTDTRGKEVGWAVALIPNDINWKLFEEKLYARIHDDKRWSVYSGSYDRVLQSFPPYRKLIEDVVSVVPDTNRAVADLGCGTGNVTEVLIERGHRVTAIDDNLGMLDRFAAKSFDSEVTTLIKSSVEHMEFLPANSFDAVVMVNVLYTLNRPLDCLRSVCRILKPNGVVGLSTTHRETNLDPLLDAIERELERSKRLPRLSGDWDTVYKVNKSLEQTVVRRFTRDDIREMVRIAGFDIIKDEPSTYEGAVMLLHARRRTPTNDSAADHRVV